MQTLFCHSCYWIFYPLQRGSYWKHKDIQRSERVYSKQQGKLYGEGESAARPWMMEQAFTYLEEQDVIKK